MTHPKIETRCPACGNATLFIGDGGWLVCSWLKCPAPALINDLGRRQIGDGLTETRLEALKEIFAERVAQDAIWRQSAFPVMNAQYDYAAPHVLVIDMCVTKLKQIWYGSKDEGTLRERFVKIAACALRALEEIKHTRG